MADGCTSGFCVADDLFLIQRGFNTSRVGGGGDQLRVEDEYRKDWIVPVVSVICVAGALVLSLLVVLTERFWRGDHIVKSIIIVGGCAILVSWPWVSGAELLELAPRVTKEHSFLLALLDLGFLAGLLPISIYACGWDTTKQLFYPATVLGLVCLGNHQCWCHSLYYISTSTSAMIFVSTPIIVYPLEVLLLGVKVSFLKSSFAVMAFFGLALMTFFEKNSSYGPRKGYYHFCERFFLLMGAKTRNFDEKRV